MLSSHARRSAVERGSSSRSNMNRRTMRGVFLASLLAGSALLGATRAEAAVPQTLTHQGRLYDAADAPIDSTLTVTFAIYADATGSTALWTETDSITFEDGYFSVSLGEVT